MKKYLEVKLVEYDEEVVGIRALQETNLKTNLSDVESSLEGFVTAVYSVDFLKLMNDKLPSVVAKDGDVVVGYALAVTREVAKQHKLLSDLMEAINIKSYRDRAVGDIDYIIVGQLCVAKGYRGQGIAGDMYRLFRDTYSRKGYCYCITDVAENNPRSIRAHEKAGFHILFTKEYSGSSWHVVIWDWT